MKCQAQRNPKNGLRRKALWQVSIYAGFKRQGLKIFTPQGDGNWIAWGNHFHFQFVLKNLHSVGRR